MGARMAQEGRRIYRTQARQRGEAHCGILGDEGEEGCIQQESRVERIRKAYSCGTLTKAQVNKRGYNRFLEIRKDVVVRISEEKILEDVRWGGLKGYVTNTDLPAEDVVAQYRGLWVVERAFRISKGTLDMRPMFHFNERRVEAHVCICFAADKVYKELECIIAITDIPMSVDKVLDIARTITTIRVKMPQNHEVYTKTLFLSDQQKAIQPLFDLAGLWVL